MQALRSGDLISIPHVNRTQLYAKRRRNGLDHGELARSGRYGRIAKNGHSRCAGGDLLEQLQPFPAHQIFENGKAGDVATWSCQAVDITSANWIDDCRKDNQNDAGYLDQRCNSWATFRQDHVRRECSQFRRVFPSVDAIASRPADIDDHVGAYAPTQFL